MTYLSSFALAMGAAVLAASAPAQSFGGLKVGGNSSAVAGFNNVIAMGNNGSDRYAKFRMPDGHDLSVTTRNFGPIIYLENNRNLATQPSTGTGLRFGLTTRADLLTLLGNPGFTYANRTRVASNGGTTLFHSYELSNQPGVVVTFAFHLGAHQAGQNDNSALLDGIIVAEAWYLDEIWGANKTALPGYQPITLQY